LAGWLEFGACSICRVFLDCCGFWTTAICPLIMSKHVKRVVPSKSNGCAVDIPPLNSIDF
jgi:hypothetical protein